MPLKPNLRVTLRDVARVAGVSIGTASKVLSEGGESHRVGASCRERIQAAARKLGYTPSFFAKSLREGQRAMVLGLIRNDIPNPTFDNDQEIFDAHYWAPLLEGMATATHEAGMHLSLIYRSQQASAWQCARVALLQGRIDALILLGYGVHSGTDLAGFDDLTKPVVGIEWPSSLPPVASIDMDEAAGVQAALAQFSIAGRRSVLWLGPSGPGPWSQRQRAAMAHAADYGMDARIIEQDTAAPIGGRRIADLCASLLRSHAASIELATAALCYNETYAAGLYLAAEVLHRRIPDDLSVIAFGNVYAYRFIPPLTAIDPTWFHIGKSAAELAISGISAPENWQAFRARRQVIPGRIVARESVCPRCADASHPAGPT